jgi:cobalt-zinc-cadmium efflux system membrane fusion protein
MKTEISNNKRSAAKAPKLGIGFWLRLSFAAIVAALLVIALAGCKQAAKADDAPAPKISANEIIFPTNAPQLASITVETTQNSSNTSVTLSGRLVWNDDFTVRIYSPVAGRVTKINAEPGQELSAGDALAEVDSPDFWAGAGRGPHRFGQCGGGGESIFSREGIDAARGGSGKRCRDRECRRGGRARGKRAFIRAPGELWRQ